MMDVWDVVNGVIYALILLAIMWVAIDLLSLDVGNSRVSIAIFAGIAYTFGRKGGRESVSKKQ